MAIKITEKPLASEPKSGLQLFIAQMETLNGSEVLSLRRITEALYEWSQLPHDIRTSIMLLINAIRQQGWQTTEEIEAAIEELNTELLAEIGADRSRLTAIEAWDTKHSTQITGQVTLTNSLEFPFNNSEKSVSITTQDNAKYVVLTEIVSAVGNPGEIEVSDKLNNGFKLSFTGSASQVIVKYTVIGGYAS